ncbi:hypothetical protein [Embleya sp. NPDC005575]|uniref:hypothetical protein n=1 Tax=Embleya sp. NPDC005575 TaxID=3156892 RepID=UPI0033BC53BA
MAVYRAAAMHSAMMVAPVARGETIGTPSLVRAGDSLPFAEDDVEMAHDLAHRAATCVDNARRYPRAILDRMVVPPVEDGIAVMAARRVGEGGNEATP